MKGANVSQIIWVLALATAACNGDTATAPSGTVDPAPTGAIHEDIKFVPFKESYRATGHLVDPTGCPAGWLKFHFEGQGQATHLGRYSITNSHCVNLDTEVFVQGEFVKTMASGDQLYGTYAGETSVITAPSPCIAVLATVGDLSFTGGTGRFAGAQGNTTMTGTQRIDVCTADLQAVAELSMEGSISSVGTSK
jgi:hypothetical protein